MNVKDAFEKFIIDKRIENLTEKTIDNYLSFVGLFIRYIGASNDISILEDDLTLKKYILHLQDRNLTGKTIHTYVKHIKVFYAYLYKYNHIKYNTALDIRIRYEKKLPEILTIDEIKKIVSVCNLRDKTIILLALDTGIRKREISTLSVLNIRKDKIFTTGKGRKDRVVPINPLTYDMLQEYIKSRKKYTDIVFQTSEGTPLSYSGLRQVFRRLKNITGIKRLSPHLLRHTYATHFIERGGDIKMLQILLGHAETRTTEIYIHLANVLHVEKYAKYSVINALED